MTRGAMACMVSLALVLVGHQAAGHESTGDMLSAPAVDGGIDPGSWQGTWRITRDDPRIRIRGGAEFATLQVMHDAGDDFAQVGGFAGRAICDDPLADPCEWIGVQGETSRARVSGSGLYLLMPVSADAGTLMRLHLSRPEPDATGIAYDGFVRYRLLIQLDGP